MFKKISEISIDNIHEGRFYFLGVYYNRIFWTNHEIVFIYDGQIKELVRAKKLERHKVFAGKYLYLESFDLQVERRILNLESLQIQRIDNVEIFSGTKDFFIGIDQRTKETLALTAQNFDKLWIKEGMSFFTQIKHFTFSRDSEMLALYDNDTGNELWKVADFSAFDYETKVFVDEPPEQHKAAINRIIGVYNDVVWITLNSGRLLGYNVIDGKLLYNITFPNFYYQGYKLQKLAQSGFWGGYTQLDEQQGMLFGLLRDEYWEIDLNDPENTFILYSLKESARHFDLTADGNMFQPFTNNEIFFYMLYPKTNAFGVFDRNLKEIVWAAPVEKSSRGFPSIRKMEYENERLYLLTDNGKIIIYEKET